MTPETGLIAGLSVTALIAATSVIDRSKRRNKQVSTPKVGNVKPTPAFIPRSASQETPYVFGNMVLITNM